MDTTSKKNLEALLKKAKKSTTWKEKAKAEIENEGWLRRSFFIALAINKELKEKGNSQTWLAEQLGFSRQYMHKLLKGKENLTLETIFKLEQALGIELMRVPNDFKENQLDIEATRSRVNRIEIQNLKHQVVAQFKYREAMQVVYVAQNQNEAA